MKPQAGRAAPEQGNSEQPVVGGSTVQGLKGDHALAIKSLDFTVSHSPIPILFYWLPLYSTYP